MLLDTLHDLTTHHGIRQPSAKLLVEFNRRILNELIAGAEQQTLDEYFGFKLPKKPLRKKAGRVRDSAPAQRK